MSLAGKAVATAVNGLEYARFGGLRTDSTRSPYAVVANEAVAVSVPCGSPGLSVTA